MPVIVAVFFDSSCECFPSVAFGEHLLVIFCRQYNLLIRHNAVTPAVKEICRI